jgi:hypothetical protein
MIHEMAAEDFPTEVVAATTSSQPAPDTTADMGMYNEADLHWVDPSHGPIADFETDFSHGAATGVYQANFDLGYG